MPVEDDVAPVVLPSANIFRAVPLAAVVAPEITITPAPAPVVENPTLTPPSPSNEILLSVTVEDVVAPVVFPSANRFCTVPDAAAVGTEITTLDPLMPTEAAPAPSNDSEPAAITPEDVEVVVLPTAYSDSVGAVCAAVVAPDMTTTPAPAAVVENPTDTPPSPSKLRFVSVCVVLLVAPVVFPSATALPTVPDPAAAGTDKTSAPADMPAESTPVADIDRLPSVTTDELDCAVVLPAITMLSAVLPLITTLDPETPTLTAPAPSKDRLPAWIAPELVDVVVLPPT